MRYFYKYNEELNKKVNSFFEELENFSKNKFNNHVSVLLLGSLSRGEGTWTSDKSGNPQLLSDIEFYTIYDDAFNGFYEFDYKLKELNEKLFFDQNSKLFHIDNTYVHKRSLKKLGNRLIVFDAEQYGKAVIGSKDEMEIPLITINSIDYVDIYNILLHRIFSVVYFGRSIQEYKTSYDYRYSIAKNSLDTMTVLLAENGKLISGFVNRYTEVAKLNIPEKWKHYYKYCLSIKLQIPCNEEFSIDEMELLFIEIVKYLEKRYRNPLINRLVNLQYSVRRVAGVTKRALKYHHIPCSSQKHFKHLIAAFENEDNLQRNVVLDNLVINGYPLV